MTDQQSGALATTYPKLHPMVLSLTARGLARDEAWLTAGAVLAYTGIAKIPEDIVDAAGAENASYPKVVGQINDVLRGKQAANDKFDNLDALFRNLEMLPDFNDARLDPTRMMNAYPGIDQDYAEGNVVLMGEVGSVARDGPDQGYYTRQYRLHFKGGLKDITAVNPEQQEVIYAPGSAYKVDSVRTGKVKVKKGNQAHKHIHLRYIARGSAEYLAAVRDNKIVDQRVARFRH